MLRGLNFRHRPEQSLRLGAPRRGALALEDWSGGGVELELDHQFGCARGRNVEPISARVLPRPSRCSAIEVASLEAEPGGNRLAQSR